MTMFKQLHVKITTQSKNNVFVYSATSLQEMLLERNATQFMNCNRERQTIPLLLKPY